MGELDDLNSFAKDLYEASATAGVRALPVMHRAGNNIQRDARQFAPGAPRARAYPSTITYDLTVEDGAIVVEVGPDRELNGQAKLGNIFEYGAPALDVPAQAHLGPALDREIPNVDHFLGEVAARSILR